ncbi:MAG: RNA polymerase subunit sigma-70, partial [Ruminococcaceae bacterium]|nr:RNA polymerase subunit sigma-70 [Oscillospiraceae bacterium]
MPYIQRRANSVKIAGLEKDDLVQEGLIGLFKAINSYDKQLGTAFSTYAITCINNCINTAVKQAARKKHLPLNSYLSLSNEDGIELRDDYSLEDVTISKEEYG